MEILSCRLLFSFHRIWSHLVVLLVGHFYFHNKACSEISYETYHNYKLHSSQVEQKKHNSTNGKLQYYHRSTTLLIHISIWADLPPVFTLSGPCFLEIFFWVFSSSPAPFIPLTSYSLVVSCCFIFFGWSWIAASFECLCAFRHCLCHLPSQELPNTAKRARIVHALSRGSH
jgi:hypothetical protein